MIDGMDKPRSLGSGDEGLRRENVTVLVNHTEERLVMRDRSTSYMHYGLVIQNEAVYSDGLFDLLLPVHLRMHTCPAFILLREKVPPTTSRFFSLVHSQVGCGEQIMDIFSVERE